LQVPITGKNAHKTDLLHIFLIQTDHIRWAVMVGGFSKHDDMTDSAFDLLIISVTSGKHLFTLKSHIGSGSKSHGLFRDLMFISVNSILETGETS